VSKVCQTCGGMGLRVMHRENGEQYVQPCECRIAGRAARMLRRAQIPERYAECALDNYAIFRGADRSLGEAHRAARKFVESYPLGNKGNGLLLTGSIGVGKTHLAVGILRELVTERGATGLFCDYRDLLKQVQNSYNKQVAATETAILQPVFDAEVLVLDELGAYKPTDWVWDTAAQILNTRYNSKRTTILTTNYANLPAGSIKEDTLGDRIGERMRSRLQEMCAMVQLQGKDFRESVKRAAVDA